MANSKVLKLLIFACVFYLCNQFIIAQEVKTNYNTYQEAEGVWRIVEDSTVNIYLIEGKDSALVIDAGFGNGNLKEYIQKITKLPLIVVNTHGHYDHNGADNQFSKVYVHPNDFYLINQRFDENKSFTLIPIKEGYIFDLGDRTIEVIEAPGHTLGSICLIDKKNKLLFAGDHINTTVWLFLEDCLPLEIYLVSLQKINKRINDFNIIMPGHNEPLDGSFINEKIACVENILSGKGTSVPYNFSEFTKGVMLGEYKSSKVAYDPNKLNQQINK